MSQLSQIPKRGPVGVNRPLGGYPIPVIFESRVHGEVPQPQEPVTPVVPDAPVSPVVPDPEHPADPEEPARVPNPAEPPTPAVPEPGPEVEPGGSQAGACSHLSRRAGCTSPGSRSPRNKPGFEGLWISGDFHPWDDKQGHSPLVWSTIGAVAHATDGMTHATDGMKVTTAVTCPTIRIHPAIIAQAAATSAVLLDGRFCLGVGSGEALNAWSTSHHDLPQLPPPIIVSGFASPRITRVMGRRRAPRRECITPWPTASHRRIRAAAASRSARAATARCRAGRCNEASARRARAAWCAAPQQIRGAPRCDPGSRRRSP